MISAGAKRGLRPAQNIGRKRIILAEGLNLFQVSILPNLSRWRNRTDLGNLLCGRSQPPEEWGEGNKMNILNNVPLFENMLAAFCRIHPSNESLWVLAEMGTVYWPL
jgi:hypothetical protein